MVLRVVSYFASIPSGKLHTPTVLLIGWVTLLSFWMTCWPPFFLIFVIFFLNLRYTARLSHRSVPFRLPWGDTCSAVPHLSGTAHLLYWMWSLISFSVPILGCPFSNARARPVARFAEMLLWTLFGLRPILS